MWCVLATSGLSLLLLRVQLYVIGQGRDHQFTNFLVSKMLILRSPLHFALLLWILFLFSNFCVISRSKGSKHMHSIPATYSKVSDYFLLCYFFHSPWNHVNSNNFIFLCEYINPVLVGKNPRKPNGSGSNLSQGKVRESHFSILSQNETAWNKSTFWTLGFWIQTSNKCLRVIMSPNEQVHKFQKQSALELKAEQGEFLGMMLSSQ